MKPGDQFLGYRLLYCVGVGGISEVWAAQHEFLGHECALKFLQVQNRSNPKLVERAKNEAIALARLRHINLVQVTDAGITPEGVVWMAMPLLKGMNLRDYLAQKGRLPILDALRFARDICDGTRAAHEVGIVHRDLKPENVFLTERHEIVVLDLGVAKFQDIGMKSTGEGKGALGTVRYMSPEHVSSRKVDHRTDQYAVGVMLYEMLWGEHPFHRGDDGQELDKYQIGLAHTVREPRPLTALLPGLPAYVWDVVARAMRKNPDERFATMADLGGAIRAVRKQLAAELSGPTNELGPAEASVPSQPGAERAYLPPQSVPRFMAPASIPSARVVPAAWSATPPYPGAQAAATPALGSPRAPRAFGQATTEPSPVGLAPSGAPPAAQSHPPQPAPGRPQSVVPATIPMHEAVTPGKLAQAIAQKRASEIGTGPASRPPIAATVPMAEAVTPEQLAAAIRARASAPPASRDGGRQTAPVAQTPLGVSDSSRYAPTEVVPRARQEATPPPSTGEPRPASQPNRALLVLLALVVGAVLTGILQLVLRAQRPAGGEAEPTAIPLPESKPLASDPVRETGAASGAEGEQATTGATAGAAAPASAASATSSARARP